MVRRFSRLLGDNAPAYALMEYLTVYGSGQIHIPIGWRPCAVMVLFSRLFEEKSYTLYAADPIQELDSDPKLWVDYIDPYTGDYASPFDATGFWLQYRNIPRLDSRGELLGLRFNYVCES
jgi:hypothetical protein